MYNVKQCIYKRFTLVNNKGEYYMNNDDDLPVYEKIKTLKGMMKIINIEMTKLENDAEFINWNCPVVDRTTVRMLIAFQKPTTILVGLNKMIQLEKGVLRNEYK